MEDSKATPLVSVAVSSSDSSSISWDADKFEAVVCALDPLSSRKRQADLESSANDAFDNSSPTAREESEVSSEALEEQPQKKTLSKIKQEEASFYEAEENKHGDDDIWGLLSGVGGNIYEWYDFAVYGLLANEIGQSFFPNSSPRIQLLNSFGVYLAAFLMRPLGAIVFGEMGDRVIGRKNALVMSIVLITVPSVAMGLLPGYDTLGPIAPILLVILRMMQGLSVGGQLAGSYVLSIEQSTSANRGIRGAICDASSTGGFLTASAVTTVVRSFFSEEEMARWAWRIPFWFSLLLAPLLYHIVQKTEESKHWKERNFQKETEEMVREEANLQKTPAVVDLFQSPFRRRQLAGMVGVMACSHSSFYTLFLWVPVYLANLRGLTTETKADFINFCVVGCYMCLTLMGGKLSDCFPHRMDLMRIGIPGIMVACPTMFGMFESESTAGIVLGQLQFAFCLSLMQGGMAAWEVELWMADPSLCYTGVAIGHNLSSTIFGGTLPLLATYLFYVGESFADGDEEALVPRLIPGFYVTLVGCVSFWCITAIIRHPHDVRTGERHLRQIRKMTLRRRREQLKLRALSSMESFASSMKQGSFCKPPPRDYEAPPDSQFRML